MYYIGIYVKGEMKIQIQIARNAQEALQNVINQYPSGIITFIYKE